MPTHDGNIAADLTAWREHHGITQAQAAAVLDVPLRSYQGWEAGRPVDRPEIYRLALKAASRKIVKSKVSP